MKKKTAELLANWHSLSMDERLAFLDELMAKDELDDEVVAALHDLFLQEAEVLDGETLDGILGEVLAQVSPEPEAAPKPKRRRKAKATPEQETAGDQEQPEAEAKPKKRRRRKKAAASFAQETMLEFAETKDGIMILREVGLDEEPLVSIAFSDKVKDMLGDDARVIGQAMIHAAIASVVQRQSNFYHANVYDEEPISYS